MLAHSPISGMSSENVINGIMGETTPSTSEYGCMKVSALYHAGSISRVVLYY